MTSEVRRCYQVDFCPTMLHPRCWGAWIAIGALVVLAYTPIRLRHWVAKATVPLFRPLLKKPTRIAKANLAACYPDMPAVERAALLDELFYTFLMVGMGMGTLAVRDKDYLASKIRFSGMEHVKAAQAQGKPVVFLVPHMFGIEYAGAALSMAGLPMLGMVKHHRNPVFNWLACRQRARFGGKLFHRNAGLTAVIRELKQGYSFFYLPDQDHGADKSEFAPFFATQKATLPVISRIAHCADAVVLPLTVGLEKMAIEVSIDAPLVLERVDKPTEARLLNEQMERLIDRHRGQYMWFLKVLKTRPEGEGRLY
ncbi:lauroyl-Kdo(2)-lipid IV(A) myristoyltransferase [Ferrimonas balearica]|uniref:LpxL/LpxP family acyltransferase n=1 Tax=Ferrimonas balearica TaxID=44012 RepID=UPI001C99E0BB|nr:lauroyl-Kdo(2)-lipid IV(A) myristoyltransferase [Ferrimonas balearica]MBY5991844.1 lauroyl-Kdo(2)-lipid IV(A) myristoyltransferase [Ferrimonas balearica]